MSRGGPRSSAHGATTTPNMSELDLLCRGAPVTASTDTPRLLLSTEQVAQALAVSPRFVKNLIYSGELPSCRVGRLRRIYIGDLCEWVEALRDAGAKADSRQGSASPISARNKGRPVLPSMRGRDTPFVAGR